MITNIVLQLTILFGSLVPGASSPANIQSGGSGFRVREPNLYAPQLYADNLDFVANLVKLPGVDSKRSYWELSYQLFFVPEDKYYEALKRLPKGPSNPSPEEFPGRILLAQGHKRRMRVSTQQERTIMLTGVPFKRKVPDAQRTKYAYLLTAYSVKIFDAELKTTVYYSGIFLTQPYEESSDQKEIARRTIYLNFGVNRDGSLNRSQVPFSKLR
ncbi:MAG TPA: hypothetical protein VGQ41_13315 [Pyrinomonadaceae bacterium]|jgi:hypothetical protein|nr:hypothetical protein [Pyrinomonadaceae bacterium]